MDLIEEFRRITAANARRAQEVESDWRSLGLKARKLRKEAKVSLRFLAGRMGISAPSLSDMELGRRHWTEERIRQFVSLLNP